LEILTIMMLDRCTDCVEQTMGLEIVLDALEGPPRWQGSSGNSFRSVWR
jgi:hypothetical protein